MRKTSSKRKYTGVTPVIIGLVSILAGCATLVWASDEGKSWTSLFDGKTLNGWKAMPGGEWKVEDGSIVGKSPESEKRHGMLVSDKEYSDFKVRLKYKAISGNSGFYFRAEKVEHAVSVAGFQAEIDSRGNDVGGIYETLGRAWVSRPSKELTREAFKPQEWNEMVVHAEGRNVTVHLNGKKTADLKNDKGRIKGFFGLQLHGGQDMHVLFKDIAIIDLSRSK